MTTPGRSTGPRRGGPGTRSAASPSRCGSAKPLEDFPFTRTYVKALREPRATEGTGNSAFWRAAEYAKSNPAWRYREIDTDHMIPVNKPAEMVKLLLELT